MRVDTIRSILRTATSDLHHQLDSAVGEFDTRSSYIDFVQKTHRFRLAAEQALASDTEVEWAVDAIADLAAQDLADLAVPTLPQAGFAVSNWTRGSRIGALYVLEGSALGARLLLRRAQALGMSPDFGARHLAHQAAGHQRWRDFLSELESVPVEMQDEALNGAGNMFRLALSIYTENARECA